MRRIALLIALFAGLVSVLPVKAQETPVSVAVRSGVQDGFIRLVFSGTGLPQASITESAKDSLNVTFAKAVALTGAETATAGLEPQVTLSAEDKTVRIKTQGLTRHRTLTLGDRLFVDLFTSVAPKASENAPKEEQPKPETLAPVAASLPEKTPEPAPEPAATSLVSDNPSSVTEVAENAAINAAKSPAETSPSSDAAPVLDPAMPAIPVGTVEKTFAGSAVITIGSTQGVALAAFVRSGHLWIVLSQETLSVPPLISGPNASELGPVDTVKIDGGSAYRIKLPEGAHIRPEGAGLVWRLYVDGNKTPLRSVGADRDFTNTAEGPQVHIPLGSAINVLRLPDPLVGDDLAVVTVGRADARLVSADSFVDFDLLPAIVGAVIRPKADGMRIAVLPKEVIIARQGGLRMSASGPRNAREKPVQTSEKATATRTPPSRMFQLTDWAMGGPAHYLDMRRSIDEKVATAEEDKKLPELIDGAKFMLGQGLPQEATGFLQMSLTFLPLLRESAEFQAVRGAVLALGGQPQEALTAFATPGLETNDEINLWRAYAYAQQNDLLNAQKLMPRDNVIITDYPARLQALMLPNLIEVALARGDVSQAETMIDMYESAADGGYFDRDNAIAYFRGRVAQLRGDIDGSSDFFREASDGVQGPYPVRATLALVERGLSAKTIARDDAIRKLERFRFGWRGDTYESQVLERLGLIYVTGGEQRRGLTILRDAATMASVPEDQQKLVAVMQKAFRELFSGKTREKMTPLESAAVAAEFAELMPAGGDGEKITMTIADQMVAVDLLERAAELIEPMVENTEKLSDALSYAQRAAAIRLIDNRPDDALKIIDKALSRSDALANPKLSAADLKAVTLLRAKAMGDLKRTDAALSELSVIPEDAESLRLKADIAWDAQRWDVAADALGKLVQMAGLDATRPPTRDQAQLVLNQALALNLAGNGPDLDALRIAYGDIMRRSELNQPFQLVTRTAREAKLADRQTLLKLVSEVNMFKDVLDNYKTTNPAPAPAPKAAEQKALPPAASAPTQKETKTN